MPDVVGVRFKHCGKIYDFTLNGVSVRPGMSVVVESEMGLGLGLVVKERHSVNKPVQQFKKILRMATVQDLETDRNNRSLENEAKDFCAEKTRKHKLPMKIVGTEATLDRKRLVFYFTADGRIDFRELVRDLASKFKTRIEMRQIGVRDEVKSIGGIGCCGREVCCKVFLTSFEPISIRMAKKQELVLNPGKLSGICGRLMCCLGYEINQPAGKERKVRGKDKKIDEPVITETKEELTVEKPIVTAPPPVNTPKPAETAEIEKEGPKSPHHRRSRHRRKPQSRERNAAPEKSGSAEHKSTVAPEKSGSAEHKSTAATKDKGRPFNKRRDFWKKKNKNKKND